MAQACYPSYSGGKDQEYDSSKPAQANSSARPYLKIPFKKRAGGKAQGVGPEFKLQYHKKKKEEIMEEIIEKLMEKLQDTAKQKVQDAFKKYQDTTNKELEKTQKQLNELREDFKTPK
jgi:predicted nucleotide-binding protein (sugar kinase/HSP70/actin superfamily)